MRGVARATKGPYPQQDTTQPLHPIQVVARRSGLTADVIRVWERRYRAVAPQRSPVGRRLYSDRDIDRLILLRKAIQAGRRIGDVAGLPDAELVALVTADSSAAVRLVSDSTRPTGGTALEQHVETCLAAVRQMRPAALESALASAAVEFSQPTLLEDIVGPLLRLIGEQCRAGKVRPAHEHAASAVIRAFLSQLHARSQAAADAPAIIVTTPAGQNHELGALMAAVAAASEGWKVIYLGPNLPADEIASAVAQTKAQVAALSIVYPTDDVRLPEELRRLRAQMPEDRALIIGGSGSKGYGRVLTELRAIRPENLDDFRMQLQKLRLSLSPLTQMD